MEKFSLSSGVKVPGFVCLGEVETGFVVFLFTAASVAYGSPSGRDFHMPQMQLQSLPQLVATPDP